MRIIITSTTPPTRGEFEFYCKSHRYENGFLVMTDAIDARNNPSDRLPDEIAIPTTRIDTVAVYKTSVNRPAYLYVDELSHLRGK